jgi:hypothetical protein
MFHVKHTPPKRGAHQRDTGYAYTAIRHLRTREGLQNPDPCTRMPFHVERPPPVTELGLSSWVGYLGDNPTTLQCST